MTRIEAAQAEFDAALSEGRVTWLRFKAEHEKCLAGKPHQAFEAQAEAQSGWRRTRLALAALTSARAEAGL